MEERKYYMIQRLHDNKYVEYIYRTSVSFDYDEGDALEFESLEDAKCFLKYVKKNTSKSDRYRIIANVTVVNCAYSDDDSEVITQ